MLYYIVCVIKNIKIYIIFFIRLVSLKKISIVCYNIKVQNIYTYNFSLNQNNSNHNIIKTIVLNLCSLSFKIHVAVNDFTHVNVQL
jgi:hypothetical protein